MNPLRHRPRGVVDQTLEGTNALGENNAGSHRGCSGYVENRMTTASSRTDVDVQR